ncbi:hypothetical protein B0T22DRAFT_499394 [Podospora appendiculata]|uniref:Uncharacterized protein n=1 Tax=Podospora appendiculata TaxID=314037 RepID=A0AAE0XCF1_9PEZI|nr:hypothetical protein B0T22DRAFT_499394 [Podospora appendiculata]
MRHNVLAPVALAAASLLSGTAYAARVCGTGTGTFQYRLLDLRYDSPDPSKNNGLSTVAASLGSSTTPLYECVVQWPEAWAGWYKGGNGTDIIWSDCIWTGAGAGSDTTVSFAVDWRKKIAYVAHTFACSDKQGTDGLATGSVALEISCSTADDNSFCAPKITSTGARPDIRISTTQQVLKPQGNAKCDDNAKQYQSWRVDKWTRLIEMAPGSTSAHPLPLKSDSGPAFVLRNLAGGGAVFSCTSDSSGQMNSTFLGVCKSTTSVLGNETTAARFSFDPKLDLVTLEQDWDCGSGSVFEAVGVAYMQAACDRRFNSDVFVCTSEPVWVGTATF